jgi:hypothetical protein
LLVLPCEVVHTYNPSTLEAHTGGLGVWGIPGLHSKTISKKNFSLCLSIWPTFSSASLTSVHTSRPSLNSFLDKWFLSSRLKSSCLIQYDFIVIAALHLGLWSVHTVNFGLQSIHVLSTMAPEPLKNHDLHSRNQNLPL